MGTDHVNKGTAAFDDIVWGPQPFTGDVSRDFSGSVQIDLLGPASIS